MIVLRARQGCGQRGLQRPGLRNKSASRDRTARLPRLMGPAGVVRAPCQRARRALLAALVYHALNGLRVIAMDFWPSLTIYYRPLTYGVMVATIIAMVPLALMILRPFAPWG